MWPVDLPQLRRDNRNIEQLLTKDIVPARLEELLVWLKVVRINGGPERF